ncbi:hypothetical protein ACFL35_07160 [Candidatus Riflebacteria bacterium]
MEIRPLIRLITPSLILFLLTPCICFCWGRNAHRLISKKATERERYKEENFFTRNRKKIKKLASAADQRKLRQRGEAIKHYINVESFPLPLKELLSYDYASLKKRLGYRKLRSMGTLPWSITYTRRRLTSALKNKDTTLAILLAADLGHYVADLCQPLHVTKYFDGRGRENRGIHKNFETRLFNRLQTEIKIIPFSMEYLPNNEFVFYKYIEDNLKKIEIIFKKDLLARQKDPLMDEVYYAELKVTLGKMLKTSIQQATELLAKIYFSIQQDLATQKN